MKKEYLLFSIIVLLVFFIGLFIGTQLKDTGRYQEKDYDNGKIIFDTKTGINYFGEKVTKKYYMINIIDGTSKEYKSENIKK